MICRTATPADGKGMLRLIESHPAGGDMGILYTRQPDAYASYLSECPGAEMIVCAGDDGRILAQIACLPRKMHVSREIQTVGYVTGLHKEDGAFVNIIKMFDAGRALLSADRLFCSILDDNKSALDMFAKRGMLAPICDYTTYLIHPRALRPRRHSLAFRRAAREDAGRLLRFYGEAGAGYSYFPVISDFDSFPGLTVSSFCIMEDDGDIVAAGALWDQRSYRQYMAVRYGGAYRLAACCSPLLRLLHCVPLPKKNAAANFAYVSFLLCRNDSRGAVQAFLGELAAVGRGHDFLAIGAVNGSKLEEALAGARSIKIGSKLCEIDYGKGGSALAHKTPPRFECALL
jgi:hypothetical protein